MSVARTSSFLYFCIPVKGGFRLAIASLYFVFSHQNLTIEAYLTPWTPRHQESQKS